MYGQIDITTVHLCSQHWQFALPRHLHWPTIRAVPPKLEDPAGRYFIHCIQHWILRDPRTNPFKTMRLDDVWQETILVDSHGEIYTIKAYPNMPKDGGVYYFSLQPDASYTPLTSSQIDAVKEVRLEEAAGWEGLPSRAPFATDRIRQAIQAAEMPLDPQIPPTDEGCYMEPEPVGARALQCKPVEEPVDERTPLTDPERLQLCNAYIHAQYGSAAEKEDGLYLLRDVLRRCMHRNAWARIDHMTRTMLAHRIAKRYEIEFPAASEKKQRLPPAAPLPLGYLMF